MYWPFCCLEWIMDISVGIKETYKGILLSYATVITDVSLSNEDNA